MQVLLNPITISTISIIISIVGMTIGISQYYLAYQAFKQNHEYNRRLNTAQLINQWDEKTSKIRQVISHHWPEIQTRTVKIDWKDIEIHKNKEIEEIKKYTQNYPQTEQTEPLITEHMSMLLNWLEVMAIYVKNSLINEEMLKDSMGYAFHKWYIILKDYVEQRTIEVGDNPWIALDELHERWFGPDIHRRSTPVVLGNLGWPAIIRPKRSK